MVSNKQYIQEKIGQVLYWYKCKTVKFVDVNNIECIPKFRVTKMNMNRTNKPKEVEVARFVPKEVFTYVGQNKA